MLAEETDAFKRRHPLPLLPLMKKETSELAFPPSLGGLRGRSSDPTTAR